MLIKLTPASDDRSIWMVSAPRKAGEAVPVDYTTIPPEQRSFVGDSGGYFDAEPAAEGWELKRRVRLAHA
jgi:hypothetical protein